MNINELTAKLKAAAQKAGGGKWCAFIDTKSKTYSVHTPDDNRCGDVVKWAGFDGQKQAAAKASYIATANPANILALTEALEAAEELNKHLDLAVRKAEGVSEALRTRLERAELEARTLTVKLPQRYDCEGYHIDEAYLTPADDGECYDREDVIAAIKNACASAGIKLQIEGEE